MSGGGTAQVWVAKGVYYPTTGTDRTARFSLTSGVAVYGGFLGNEWLLSDRNPAANVTTLSGGIGASHYEDNSYRVVTATGADATAVLDGFTVREGNNYRDSGGAGYGGGIYVYGASPTLSNLHLVANQANNGGALYISGGNPSLTNSTISDTSGGNGSVFVTGGAAPTLTNVAITDNVVGGIWISYGSPILTNVLIARNHSWASTGVYVEGASSAPFLTNVTVAGNSSVQTSVVDGSVQVASGSPTLTNCIVWGNTTHGPQINVSSGSASVTYSDVQSGYSGTGNINANPMFVTDYSSLQLLPGSPVIDAGTNAPFVGGIANGITSDLAGLTRRHQDIGVADTGSGTAPLVDMGAYEYQGTTGYNDGVIYVDLHNSSGVYDGRSWASAFKSLATAMEYASPRPGASMQIWVAAGGYKPDYDNIDRSATFSLRNNVAVYGGFAGGESSLDERDWITNVTYLDADLGVSGTYTDNSIHLVTAPAGTSSSAVLDGFGIYRGYADDAVARGGGMLVYGSPTLSNLDFRWNSASSAGGGMAVLSGSPTLTNVAFRGNAAQFGGGLALQGSPSWPVSATLLDVAFSGNQAGAAGGGLYVGREGNVGTLTNVTFAGNGSATGGSAAHLMAGTLSLRNAILWGNYPASPAIASDASNLASIDTAIVQGGCPTGVTCSGSIWDVNPLFVSGVPNSLPTVSGDLRPQQGSPAINAADDGYLPSGITTDLAGASRLVGDGLDLGAYEYQGDAAAPVVTLSSLEGSSGAVTAAPWTATTSSDPILTWSASEPGTYTVKVGADCVTGTTVDGFNVSGSYVSGATQTTVYTGLSGWAEGSENVVHVCMADAAGNAGASAPVTITVDTVAPVVTLASPASGATTTPWPTLTGSAGTLAGDSTTVTVKIYEGGAVDGSPVLTHTTSVAGGTYSVTATEGLAVGTYTAQAEQLDAAGNTGVSPASTFSVVFKSGTLYVDQAADGRETGLSPADAFKDLESALAAATPFLSGETVKIYVAAGTYVPTAEATPGDARSATFTVKYRVAIYGGYGGGTTILSGDLNGSGTTDGGDAYHVVTLMGGGGIQGFTITHGSATGAAGNDEFGGGILVPNDAPWLFSNLIITDNVAHYGGGMAIVPAIGQSFYPTDLTISNNTATNGGGLYVGGSIPQFTRVTVTGNTATGSGGGLYQQSGQAYLTGSTVSHNSAPVGGGLYALGGTLGVYSSTIAENHATAGSGGGAYLSGGTQRFERDTFSANTATSSGGGLCAVSVSPVLFSDVFTGNQADGLGGGMWNEQGSPTLVNVTFRMNHASEGGGGLAGNSGSPTLVNAVISGNTVGGDGEWVTGGGGIYVVGGSPTLTNVSLGGNAVSADANFGGGALCVAAGSVAVTNAVFWGDTWGGAPDEISIVGTGSANITYSDVQGGYAGTGNINADPLYADLAGGNLDIGTGSPAIDQGYNPAVPVDILAAYNYQTHVPMDFLGRPRFHDDIGIAPNPTDGSVPVDMGAYEFQGLTPTTGGIVYVDKDATSGANNGSDWANAYVELRTALGMVSPAAGQTVQIWVAEGTYKPTSGTDSAATFTTNDRVQIYGGFAGGESSVEARDPSTHVTTLSGDLGGGIRSQHVVTVPYSATGDAVLDGFTVTMGAGPAGFDTQGGGLRITGSPTLANLIVSNNTGGGLFIWGGSPTLTDVTFVGNTSAVGGGIYVHNGAPALTRVDFVENTANGGYGGGGFFVMSDNAWSGTTTLTNVTFDSNQAIGSADGGGMGVHYARVTLTDVTFVDNYADGSGGGLFSLGANMVLTGAVFADNTADGLGGFGWGYGGGGMYADGGDYTGSMTTWLTNVLFSGNVATAGAMNGGGGLLVTTGTWVTLTNATFHNNSADQGGAVYVLDGSPTLTNCILWGDIGGEISAEYASPSVSYSLIEGGYAGTGNIDAAPAFVSSPSDLHLTPGSPAIDAGDNSPFGPGGAADGVTTDMEGNTRIVAVVDMGAFEFQPAYTVTFDANGGTGEMAPLSASIPSSLTLNAYTRAGYAFAGWNTDAYGEGTFYADGDPYAFDADVTLYAQWSALPTYTVTFDANGGTGTMAPQTAGSPALLTLNTFTQTGHSFDGWNTHTDGSGTAYADGETYGFDASVTLYAQWVANTYTVTFDPQGGSAVLSQIVAFGQLAAEPSQPSREGYTFGGWYREAACTNVWDFASDLVTGDVTLYAKWTVNSFTVTFDYQYESLTQTQSVDYGCLVPRPADPSRTGYSFDGWYGDQACTDVWDFAGDMVTADVTLYAKWTALPMHTVTFNANSGSGSMAPQSANVPTALTLNAFTRLGYSFTGWNTAANASGDSYDDGATYSFAADVTLYAQWTALPMHTVTFSGNNGTGTMAPQSANVPTALTLNAFTRSGYSFAGWNTLAGGGGTAYADGATYSFAADVTLYAQWTALPMHTVTFAANGGTGTMSPQSANVPTALTLNTFTRTGYSFTGWNTLVGGGGTAYTDGAIYSFAADLTLYAQWTALPMHTVTFNANSGTGTMAPQSANVPTALTLNTFTRTGYSFTGWNTAANGTGTAYANGATYSFAADVTLYAQWSALPMHTVTFNANNGTGTMSPQSANVPTALTLNAFIRSGYSFTGWDTLVGGGGTAYTDGAIYSFAADLTLYAQWTALPMHTVTFAANGGTGTMSPQSANVPTALTLNTFVRTGYSFNGWNTLPGGAGTAYADGATYDFLIDVTFYAQWTALPMHTVTFNANNGTGTMSPQSANVPTALTLNTFTRTGYSFAGWNTASNGSGDSYADGATYGFAADLTLYAQWTALPMHTVTFAANGGTGTMAPQSANVPTALTLNTYTRAGYSFSGWNTLPGGGGTAYTDGGTYSFAADLTLYAQWTALPMHTVTFNANGGSGSMSPQSANVPTALTLNSFTRTGYSFTGWNTLAGGGGTAYADGAIYSFAADLTLYAQWTALAMHTVTFAANGGTGTMAPQSANVPTALTLNTFTRTGYSFTGWNTLVGGGGTAYTDGAIYSFAADLTLYAQWTALPMHTVTFAANGGTGTMSPQSANVPTALTLNSFTRTGYSFTGWNTLPGGGGTAYADETIYSFAADLTLYAQWTALPMHTVTFNANNGTGTMAPQSANVPTALTLNTFIRTGYSFSGWNTLAGGGGTAYVDGATYSFAADATLYAQWTALPMHTVTFNGNNGTGTMAPQSANVPTALTLNTFTRTGYSFTGWNTAANGSGDIHADGAMYSFAADLTLYAQWTALPIHTVTFNANNGTGTMAPQSANVPTALTLNTFIRTGYSFSGWNTAADGSGTAYAEGATFDFAADATLYAQWTALPMHTVTFAANGGTGTMSPQSANVPTALTLNTFVRTGYSFTGWNTLPGGAGTAYADGATYGFLIDVTLYAQWTALPMHTVTFNANNGTGTMSPQSANVPTAFTLNSFTRTGYSFTGWNTAANGTGTDYADGAIYSFAADLTLYAQWTALPMHTVTFNANNGTGTMAPQSSNVPTALTINTFTRTGYSFAGWNTLAGGGGTAYTDGAIYSFAADLTLYAQWTVLPMHTVTFNANSGTGTMAPQSANVPTALTLNTFTRTGYSFTGWNTAANGTGTAYANGATYSFAADVTLYAQWSALPMHTVTFNANDGTGTMSPQSTNVPTALTLNTFTRSGYSFTGWNTLAGGGGTAYADGAIYSFAADLTLYAQWTALPMHTVTFNANNGTGTMAPQSANVPTALTLNAFTRTGYSFTGWNTAANGSGTSYVDGATYNFAADLTLYAQWTDLPTHVVTFDANGGTGTMPPQVASVPTALTQNTFTRAGYSFTGWNTAADGSGTAYAEGATFDFAADATLYAQWTALPMHTVTFDANGGSGSMAPQQANIPTDLTLNVFTQIGYSFAGWNTAADGSGVAYADGAAYAFDADVTLYAQWTALPMHTVTFEPNGGSGTMEPQSANVPTGLTLNAFTRARYSFSGWNTAADGSGTAYADGATYSFAADLTLYAQWNRSTTRFMLYFPLVLRVSSVAP